jgi:hypothetical protein
MRNKKALVLSMLALGATLIGSQMAATACEGHKGKKAPAPTTPAPAPETPTASS